MVSGRAETYKFKDNLYNMLAKEYDILYFCNTSGGTGKPITETHGIWRLVSVASFYAGFVTKSEGAHLPLLNHNAYTIFTDRKADILLTLQKLQTDISHIC